MATKVLILAGDTDGNLGDLAIVTATCDLLRRIDPDTRIALLSSRPERDSRRLGIVPIPRGWRGFGRLLACARQSDLVICGGGGLFQDDDSLLKMPYWALRLLTLRLFTGNIAGLSIGAGPLRHPVSRVFARLALKTLSPVSVRDALARAVLQPLTRKAIAVVPDPAFMLEPYPDGAARTALADAGVPAGKRLVGVSARRWFHTRANIIPHKYGAKFGLDRNRGRLEMEAFTRAVTAVLDDVAADADAHVVFLPSYNVRHENDTEVCNAIAAGMKPGTFSVLQLDDPRLYQAVAGRMDVMLCGRMHPAILAARQGTPIVGLAYNQKFVGMFSLIGQAARCLTLEDFVGNDETSRLTAMLLEAIHRRRTFRPVTAALENETARFIERLLAARDFQSAPAGKPQTQTQHGS